MSLTDFNVPNEILWDSWDEETGEIVDGGLEILDELDFEVYVPYNEKTEEIIILRLTEDDLIEFDNLEVASEPIDNIQEAVEDKKITSDENNLIYWILGGVLFVLIIVVIWLLVKRKDN